MKRIACLCVATVILAGLASAQETRSTILGHVRDPQGAVVVNATVVVTNTDTNVLVRVTSNQAGYYEAPLLLAGPYTVSAELAGFKKAVRSGITLPVTTRLEVNFALELGAVSETVSVTGEAPLMDTSTVSSGRILQNRNIMDLPLLENNTALLIKLTPGIQTSGVNSWSAPHSVNGGSDYYVNGNVGGNEWSIDGVPNDGGSRKIAYLPYADTVQEIKTETSGFDASMGHSSGAIISMMTRAGTNSFHGTLTEEHWQNRWQAADFSTRQLYYRNIDAAMAAGNPSLAKQLRSQPIMLPGQSNNYAATLGGPVVVPKLFSGKDKLFFFFSFNGFGQHKAELPNAITYTLPTMAARQGDFSQLLKVDPVRYQIYDPLSVRLDPSRPSHYIRDPIPGNVLPASRITDPVYNYYVKLLPTPNQDPIDPTKEPSNNYLAVHTPQIISYKTFSNRMDYRARDKHRFFARWSYNEYMEDRSDWTRDTAYGLNTSGLNRINFGGTVDWVYTMNSSTVLDFSVAANQYREGNRTPVPEKYKPSDVGLPAYLDAKAGDQHVLPTMSFAGYATLGKSFPTYTQYRFLTTRAELSHVHGSHTLRAGTDLRGQFRTGGGGGNTSGSFTFDNTYTRRNDDTITPAGTYGLSWAAFMMGIPSGMSADTNDSYAMYNPYLAWYVQDNWRTTRRLSVNLGLRAEYELGATERYNRAIGYFDPPATLPISSAAQAAYAKNPVPELPASAFVVQGGSIYLTSDGVPRNLWKNQLMWLPRVALAYQWGNKTVLRGGYGIFYDTLNVLNWAPDQTGFSRTTSTTLTNNFAVNWLVGNPGAGISPLTDPFPVRADGTRFDAPTRDALGLMARVGRGWSFTNYDQQHARQQRWRAGLQRQIGDTMLLDVAYTGSYSDNIGISRSMSPLPAQYWAAGQVRNTAIANNLTANVTNPFYIGNFADLKTSNPRIYQDMSTNSFFTSPTIQKQQLLRAFPQMNGITDKTVPLGLMKTHSLEMAFVKRFSKGFNLDLAYSRTYSRARTWFANEYDPLPTWTESNNCRPHRFTANGIYEMPFGKGRHFWKQGPLSYAFGGWQVVATYEWQPGALVSFGNLFYYGNIDDISTGTRTFAHWFNTSGFETNASKGPASYHSRVFPQYIDGLRADRTNQWNSTLQRDFKIKERATLQLRLDVLNVQNRSQMAAPDASPTSSTFGQVKTQSAAQNRFIQILGRIRF
jgi:hypothetical protein